MAKKNDGPVRYDSFDQLSNDKKWNNCNSSGSGMYTMQMGDPKIQNAIFFIWFLICVVSLITCPIFGILNTALFVLIFHRKIKQILNKVLSF